MTIIKICTLILCYFLARVTYSNLFETTYASIDSKKPIPTMISDIN